MRWKRSFFPSANNAIGNFSLDRYTSLMTIFPWQHVPQSPSQIFSIVSVVVVAVCLQFCKEERQVTGAENEKRISRHLLLDILCGFPFLLSIICRSAAIISASHIKWRAGCKSIQELYKAKQHVVAVVDDHLSLKTIVMWYGIVWKCANNEWRVMHDENQEWISVQCDAM